MSTRTTRRWLAGVSLGWWALGVVALALLALTATVTPGLFIDQAIGGLVYGMVLVLITLGLSLILGLMGVINFAHGAFFMFGAYVSYTVVATLGLSFWVALAVVPVVVGLLGVVVEMTVLRRIYDQDPIVSLLATFGLTLMIEQVVEGYWGTQPLGYPKPALLAGSIDLGPTTVGAFRLFIVAASCVVVAAVYLLVSRTDFGLAVRAGVQDAEMTEFVGVNLPIQFTAMFFVGAAIAGFAGALYAPEYTMRTSMGETFVILAFVVVVVGGVGSLFGSVVSGIVIGEARFLVPTVGDALAQVTGIGVLGTDIGQLVPYLVMILILLLRPRGLFGEEGFLE